MKTLIREARALLLEGRTATLATLLEGAPYASLVTYAPTPDENGALMLLSRLAIHTQNLLLDPRASLLVAKAVGPGEDPLALGRGCFMGTATIVPRDSEAFGPLSEAFRARHSSEHLFAMKDFELFRLEINDLRYVGGFGRITSIPREAWLAREA